MATLITGSGDFEATGTANPFGASLNTATAHIEVLAGKGTLTLGTGISLPLDRIEYPFYLPVNHGFTGRFAQTTPAGFPTIPAGIRSSYAFPFVVTVTNDEVPGLIPGDIADIDELAITVNGRPDIIIQNARTAPVVSIDRSGTDSLVTFQISVTIVNPGISIGGGQVRIAADPTFEFSVEGHTLYDLVGDSYILAQEPAAGTRALDADIIDDEHIEALGGTFVANTEHYNNAFGIDVVSGHGSATIKPAGDGPDKVVNLNELAYPIPLSTAGELSNISGQIFLRERSVAPNASLAATGRNESLTITANTTLLSGQGKVLVSFPAASNREDTIINLNEIGLPLTINAGTGNASATIAPMGSSVVFTINA